MHCLSEEVGVVVAVVEASVSSAACFQMVAALAYCPSCVACYLHSSASAVVVVAAALASVGSPRHHMSSLAANVVSSCLVAAFDYLGGVEAYHDCLGEVAA